MRQEVVKKMGRGRLQLKRIEDNTTRQVTFSKRRTGLLKKANEISVLCDAEVALIVFNCKGKLTEFSSQSSSMESILDRYERHSRIAQLAETNNDSQGDWSLELFKLTSRAEVLEKNMRNYKGEGLDPLSLRELQSLEHQLDTARHRVRTRKNQIMNESMSEMQRKARTLQDENSQLAREVKKKEKEKEKKKHKSLIIAERPQCGEEALGLTPFNFTFSPPQLLLPTLGGTSEARGPVVKEAEARTGPSNGVVMPPWMRFHMTR